jgi:WD40 repeat protein
LNGELINTFNGHKKAVLSLAFSPDEQMLVSGSADATIRIWPLSSFIKTFKSSFDSKSDNFRQAVNAAISAANLTQTAKLSTEWEQVINSWKQAIKLMKTIPVSSLHYPVARQKMIEYERNLNYAYQKYVAE